MQIYFFYFIQKSNNKDAPNTSTTKTTATTATIGNGENKENPSHNLKSYSPIRKRLRKEPLKLSNLQNIPGRTLITSPKEKPSQTTTPVTDSTSQQTNRKTSENHCIVEKVDNGQPPKSNETQPRNDNAKGNWEFPSPDVVILSPTCVDVSTLCDFINGVDDQIDSWLSDEVPEESDQSECSKVVERNGEITQSSKSVIISEGLILKTNDSPLGTDFEEYLNIGFDILDDEVNNRCPVKTTMGSTDRMTDVERVPQYHSSPKTANNETGYTTPLTNLTGLISTDSEVKIKKCLQNGRFGCDGDGENTEDWLGEFENDEFWGQGKENKETFDLEVVDLFQL